MENTIMKKLFNINGDLLLQFANDDKEQIVKWLDGVDYDYAVKFAKEVDCPVFGKALIFPCIAVTSEFNCIGCNNELLIDYQIRTEGFCYLCDPNITLEELLSNEKLSK